MERSIIHLNVADFAVAIEKLLDRSLCNQPVIVTTARSSRPVVHDMSEEAFHEGVRKGMLLKEARRLCRKAVLKETQPKIYQKAMRGMLRQALPYTPLVEAGNHDGHLFMDVSGTGRLFGQPSDIACRIRKSTQNYLGLNPIWTVATNKLVAKAASRLVKPSGEYIVAAGTEDTFLAPLPLSLLPGLFRRELIRMQEFNLRITGQAAALSLSQLMIPFGKRAEKIYCAVRGIDSTPVFSMARTPPKICVEHFFAHESNDWNLALTVLFKLAEKAGRRLRYRNLTARQISIFLEYADRQQAVRQTTVKKGLCHDDTLFCLARTILQRAWTRRVQLRCLRLTCDKLTIPSPQACLFPEEKKHTVRQQNLTSALDRIRGRHGEASIRHARCFAY
ncbi:MAG: hypothetical protein H8E41_06365 [Desulfobulbaceae bacterium]|uniref:UmuC domain-containing protein n=1 Tax=Candidatus Desulfobia pelagia TaxID=2841692 RepID=A0A8J6TFJ1_9BACT|nr:hypothetical protein [Candidatus Desulfobia pelagia]